MEIVWSEKADESFDEILVWIEERFSSKEVDRFVIETYEVLNGIKNYPSAYPKSKKLKNVRKAVIHPHTTLFYRVQNKSIELLFFWENRRNPSDRSI